MSTLPFREIHLDFHTSPLIPEVGADFDPAAFARTMKEAAVNSVTVFARCHHGMSYYPSKVAKVHPALERDLLGEQIAALHHEGIQAPIYITVVWDEWMGTTHPEWRQVDKDGKFVGRLPFTDGWGWKWMCMNTPYVDYLAAQTEEICKLYPVDGIFFDIVMTTPSGCCCEYCLASMKKLGLDPTSPADQRHHTHLVQQAFMKRMTSLVHSLKPEARIFYNSRLRLDPDPAYGMMSERDYYTHWEIESLPSGGWGYNHFPLYARYFQTLGKESLGMTGRFHLSWADFGGLKGEVALEYECLRQIASGSKCSIGDQLHPRGVLDPTVYDLIGKVYRKVRSAEPWCDDATPLAEIGVLMPGAPDAFATSHARETLEGAMRLLLETGQQFHILDHAADLAPYRLIIAPDDVLFDTCMAEKVRAYLASGGALLLSDRSGLAQGGDEFAIDELGLSYEGPAPYAPNFLHVAGAANELTRGVAPSDYVAYEQGTRVSPKPGTARLVEEVVPYFNRTWEHYSSHRQTPSDRPSGYPLVTRRGQVIYFAVPIFRTFQKYGNLVYKELLANAIAALLPDPLVKTGLPSTGEVILNRQGSRLVCHLLHYVPQRRTTLIDIVEDRLPLYKVDIAIRAGFKPRRVYLAPQGVELPFTIEGGYVSAQVPELVGHQMVVVE